MRDRADNVIIVCSIENIDPMGVHTGDSITVAPAHDAHRTGSTRRLRDAANAVIREIGVETGGSNMQFAVSPRRRPHLVIEMNPRVSRSSALASKATGYPDRQDRRASSPSATRSTRSRTTSRGTTPASFEPAIDYVVVKMPALRVREVPRRRRRGSARR